MIDVKKILQNTDLRELVRRAGGELSNRGRCACVLHKGKNESAFSVFMENGVQLWKCHSGDCGGGDAIRFVEVWKGLKFKDACAYLGANIETMSAIDEAQIAIKRAERAARMAEQAALEARDAIQALKSTEIWRQYHEAMDDEARAMWNDCGIPEDWQNIWWLGYCARKKYMTKQGELTTASMTIPNFAHGWEVLNIKHRLLNPLNPNDKYRPEKSGLSMPAYLCDPDMPKDKTEHVLIVEGEKKAMVTYLTLDSPKWQVIGLPGKDAKRVKGDLISDYTGRHCVVCLDPDGTQQARNLAKVLGGRTFTLPAKIDDLITQHGMSKSDLRGLILQSEKIL